MIPKTDKYGGLHFTFVVTEQAKAVIKEQSEKQGITQTEFIVNAAVNTKIPDSSIWKSIRKPVMTNDYKQKAKEFVEIMKNTDREDNDMNKKNGASQKTAQFHLRVTPETYAQIQKKANEMSMSVSDYVTFVTTRFDVQEISAKMDLIVKNQKKILGQGSEAAE